MAAGGPGLGAAVASDEPLRIAEFLCARLCHEMAGALGALMGSLDLAREDEAMAGDAIALASQAGRGLVARLRLLRAAWVGDGMPLDLTRLAELAAGLADRRIVLDLAGLPPATVFDPPIGRVVLNLVLLGAVALPAGGTVWLERVEGDLVLGVAGPRVEWPVGLAASLAGDLVGSGATCKFGSRAFADNSLIPRPMMLSHPPDFKEPACRARRPRSCADVPADGVYRRPACWRSQSRWCSSVRKVDSKTIKVCSASSVPHPAARNRSTRAWCCITMRSALSRSSLVTITTSPGFNAAISFVNWGRSARAPLIFSR